MNPDDPRYVVNAWKPRTLAEWKRTLSREQLQAARAFADCCSGGLGNVSDGHAKLVWMKRGLVIEHLFDDPLTALEWIEQMTERRKRKRAEPETRDLTPKGYAAAYLENAERERGQEHADDEQ